MDLTLRFLLDLYAGVRPIKIYPNVGSPLRRSQPGSMDLVLIRENVERFFASMHSGLVVGDQVAWRIREGETHSNRNRSGGDA